MGPETINRLKDNEIHGDFVGRDKITNIIMFQESEREFVVTHNANIKPVAYFTGRETELQDLRQRIEEGRKSVLVSGMGGIGKTHICRKLFEEYLNKHAEDENGPFRHIGYIEFNGDMSSSLQNCLKFKNQDSLEQNQEAAWRELEHLAADGKLLLFVDNVNVPIGEDAGLGRLKQIPGAVVLTSRRTSFSKEFEPYRIGFLSTEQCVEIYERIRYEDRGKKVQEGEIPDLEYIIESLAGRHTITVELLAHLAGMKLWTVKRLREELEQKGFRLGFHKDGELVNIQESYEVLYDLSELTEAEQNILEAFSVFPYIALATETCNEWLLADAGVSEDDDILIGLYHKGWLQYEVAQDSYSLHPVFAQFIYIRFKPKTKRHYELLENLKENIELLKHRDIFDSRYIWLWKFMQNVLGNLLWSRGRKGKRYIKFFKKQIDLYNKRRKEVSQVLKATTNYSDKMLHGATLIDEEFKTIADGLLYLGKKQLNEGDYENAEIAFKFSLEMLEQMSESDYLEIAIRYNNMSANFYARNDYEGALTNEVRAYSCMYYNIGLEDPNTKVMYDKLKSLYSEIIPEGDFEQWLEEQIKE